MCSQRDNARTTSVAIICKLQSPGMLAFQGLFIFAYDYSAPARHERNEV